jgi:hypothetical protein
MVASPAILRWTGIGGRHAASGRTYAMRPTLAVGARAVYKIHAAGASAGSIEGDTGERSWNTLLSFDRCYSANMCTCGLSCDRYAKPPLSASNGIGAHLLAGLRF